MTNEPEELSHNDRMRVAALTAKIRRQHVWRSKVWAECELRIQAMTQELAEIGADPVDLPHNDFSDPESLTNLANTTVTAATASAIMAGDPE